MKPRDLLLAGVAAISIGSAAPARAQIVTCLNCSTIGQQFWHDALELANWVKSIDLQIQSVVTEIEFWKTLLVNTASLPQRLYADVAGTIQSVEATAREVTMIVPETKRMIQNLGNGGGYYYGGSLDDIPRAMYDTQVGLSIAAMKMHQVMDQSSTLRATQSSQLDALAAQSDDASGIKAAVQAGNAVAATGWQQYAASQASMAAGFQTLVTAELGRADREAMLRAASQKRADQEIFAACGAIPAGSPLACSSSRSSQSYP